MSENIPDAECEAIQSKREILLVSPIMTMTVIFWKFKV